MIPIALNPSSVEIAVVGRGPLLVRRLQQLVALGAKPRVFCDAPSPELLAAGGRLVRRLPNVRDFRDVQIAWVAGLDEREYAALAADARAAKVLLNVEDVPPFCDFHTPAIVRRGDLVLAAATGGASPAAAKLARRTLENAFPETWADALAEAAADRRAARSEGAAPAAINARTEAIFSRRGLLQRTVAG